ncbi:hypothetical protein BDM02DRAFT_2549172 [Thelephora ganbajun]|uniref:Uncharacterized protein n=1 Tax=Thelephora ganbajun TaxID=370292 RepID=A0ACB6ZSW7_THEGA|nr:hypothetical protein BDM02DRAFT_2549172 [Thelephora ganbajun]
MSPKSISTLALPRSTLFALSQAGYETTDELASSTPENLARELGISVQSSQQILSVGPRLPATQSAAALLDSTNDVFRCCPPIDNLLDGGLRRGHVLELLGPPGTPKTALVLEIIRDFIENKEDVLIIDPQNTIAPGVIDEKLRSSSSVPKDYSRHVHLMEISHVAELMSSLYTLPSYLQENPKVTLLVLPSFSFFFQLPPATVNASSWRNALLECSKRTFTVACVSRNLTIVLTSQLSTRMVKADGSVGNFDTGARAIMTPSLGTSYLPQSRAYRVMITPRSRTSGQVSLG